MMSEGAALARAVSDGGDRLIGADDLLVSLQAACGGAMGETIAIPALLDLVQRARRYRLKLARPIKAQDDNQAITAWVEVEARQDGEPGCDIAVRSWHASPLPASEAAEVAQRRGEIDRELAELTALLDGSQRLLTCEVDAPDLADLAAAMRGGLGRPWTDFVGMDGQAVGAALHWRLLDGATLQIPGSNRTWRASLYPLQSPGAEPIGFELCLTTDEPLPRHGPAMDRADEQHSLARQNLVGRDIAPVLRQPIARIIANAETIRSRLAGPLTDEYANYAGDIAVAGQHLLALIDDLADLEVVEADDFSTTPDLIDLAAVARQAAGILGVRARERGITVDAPRLGETLPAMAEFRRVLQVLLNLVGNAIHYSAADSQIWIRLEDAPAHKNRGPRARVVVADQGPGLSEESQARVFEKFERLGRSGDGGSGLGLYISRRLARAMGGDLTVESAPGRGARFILDLPQAAESEASAPAGQPD
jgi:signal transduction histidine kinase